jgi:CIC family chloride channel protein
VAENIYTIKLRGRGRPIPMNRHTNMYLVQQAKELMSGHFIVLPADMPVADALAHVASVPGTHIVVNDGGRIAGYVRFGATPYTPEAYSGQTLHDLMATDFAVAGETNIFNTVISRMNQRGRTFVIVVRGNGVPRPEDVSGVIDAQEIASAVLKNHYA